MGVGNNSNAIYYSISEGKICRQFREATPNSKQRVNKNGRTVHEEYYDYIDGQIIGIEVRDTDQYGKFWNVTLEDGGQRQVLQFNYSSGYANGFLKALPNVVIGEKVKLIPSMKMEGDKKKTTLFVSQHGNPVKWYYTQEHPNGIPELKKVKVKGKEQWDDSDVMEFLEQMVKTEIVPKLSRAAQPVVAEEDGSSYEPGGDDELPF